MVRKLLAGSIFLFGGLLAAAVLLSLTLIPSKAAEAGVGSLQMENPLAPGDWELFHAVLLPENEVPPITGTMASGHAWIVLDNTTNMVHYVVHVTGIMTATGGHIHEGAAGVNGPVVVNLLMTDTLTPDQPLINSNMIDPMIAPALGSGGYYVNIHTAEYPAGVMRGQIMPMDTPDGWTAYLDASQVVPPVNSPASGKAVFSLSPDFSIMTYTITVTNITSITTATLNLGMPGEVGMEELVLFPDGGMFDPANPLMGSTPITPDHLAVLISEMYYVNIATAANPAGELRGQVRENVEYMYWLHLPIVFREVQIGTNR